LRSIRLASSVRGLVTGLPSHPGVKRAPTEVKPPELSELEDAIIRRFAEADGAPLRARDLSEATRQSLLRVEQAIERLEGVGLVIRHRSYMDGTSYGLTPRGRDLAISRGDV